MPSSSRFRPQTLARCALFAALTAVCAQITLPIGAVPVSLSLLPPLLCAVLLSPGEAVLSMGVYLLMALVGLPVCSGFSGGPAKLFGVTGGYILGYVPCVWLAAWMIRRRSDTFAWDCLSLALGVLVCYAFGTVWFMVLRGTDLLSTLSVCVFPFLPFDAVKIVLATAVGRRLRKPLARWMPRKDAAHPGQGQMPRRG